MDPRPSSGKAGKMALPRIAGVCGLGGHRVRRILDQRPTPARTNRSETSAFLSQAGRHYRIGIGKEIQAKKPRSTSYF